MNVIWTLSEYGPITKIYSSKEELVDAEGANLRPNSVIYKNRIRDVDVASYVNIDSIMVSIQASMKECGVVNYELPKPKQVESRALKSHICNWLINIPKFPHQFIILDTESVFLTIDDFSGKRRMQLEAEKKEADDIWFC